MSFIACIIRATFHCLFQFFNFFLAFGEFQLRFMESCLHVLVALELLAELLGLVPAVLELLFKTAPFAEVGFQAVQVGPRLLPFLVDDAALRHDVLHAPALEPLVEALDGALQPVAAEGDLAQAPVVAHLEGEAAVGVLVDLEDERRGEGRVLDDAVVALAVLRDAPQVALVDALDAVQAEPVQEARNRGVVAAVEGPLHAALVLRHPLEVVVRLVEVPRR